MRAAESHLRAHIIPKLGSLPLTEINTKAVQSFVAYLATGGRSKKTVENVLLTLSSILRTARSWDYACGTFSLADITMPREGVKQEQRHFTDEEVGKILSAAPEPFGTILAVTAVLGLRIGEVLALRTIDIDFTRKIVRVRQSVDAATRNVQAVKSQASSADVPMPSQLAARLRIYLQKHEGKADLLFVNRRGRPFSANKLRAKQLHPLLVKLGIPRGGFHAVRHGATSALRLILEDKPISGLLYSTKTVAWSRIEHAMRIGIHTDLLPEFAGIPDMNAGGPFAVNKLSPVRHIGTGTLLVQSNVFRDLATAHPEWKYKVRTSYFFGKPNPDREWQYDFFQCAIDPETKDYVPEDFFFTDEAKKIGYDSFVLASERTYHTGNFDYVINLPLIASHPKFSM